jgi:uncharacterized protein (TIGR03084 family)
VPASMNELLRDLAAETAVLETILDKVPEEAWELATPAEGWAIRDQVSHLAYFDRAALLAVTCPDRFIKESAQARAAGPGLADRVAERYRHMSVTALFTWFRQARTELLLEFSGVAAQTRVPWFGPTMSAASSVTARLMETWAHGQDIADALGDQRTPTTRLRNIAHLGVRTFGFSFSLRGRAVPPTSVRVVLTAPDGSTWSWGDEADTELVRGPAEDFCLVVTQRRHVADTQLEVSGATALEWMHVAQAFAGAPGQGRPPNEGGH